MQRIHIAGCPVDAITLEALTANLCHIIASGPPCQVLGVNAAFVVDASKDSNYRRILETTTFVPADGFWVAFAAKLLGYQGIAHVGIERLVYQLLTRVAQMHGRVYLLGARKQIVETAARKIEERYRGITVVGRRDGYFTEADEENILADINRAEPDLVLLGIASPKKEQWIFRYRNRLRAPVTIGVGGLFDVLAGQVPPASQWVKDWGFEWLFRLAHDPRRLWKRYTLGNAHFIWLISREWIMRKMPNLYLT